MTYQVETDILYTNFIQSKKLRNATIIQYKATLKKFCKATQNTLAEIIENCKNQQDKITETTTSQKTDQEGNIIIEKTINSFDINNPNSYINIYLNTHINYCKTKGNKNVTINHDLIYITTFLKYYGIKIPDIEKFKDDTTKWNLLTKEDFKYIMSDSTLTHQSLIKLLESSGMRLSDALRLTWADIMEGSKQYHNCVDLYDFAENAPTDMIISFDFSPTKTERFEVPCITFCDYETTRLLIQNLRKIIHEYIPRINKEKGLDLKLSKNDAVFGSQKAYFKKPPSSKSISDLFWRKNKKLREHHINLINEKIKKGELAEDDFDSEVTKIPKFHAHGCRKYFISTISKNCGDLRLCALMEGHTTPLATDSAYVKHDIVDVKEAYLVAIPDLSLENTETKTYTSEIRREMESKITALERENEELKMKNDNAVSALWEELNNMKARQEAWETFKKGS